ncbi:MAG: hypothetical protein HDS65_00580 [Bacteroidales bacterium]|nr:hypothetical protein [Bacteroidales bacterium]
MKFRNILNKAVMGFSALTAVSGLLMLTSCSDDDLLPGGYSSASRGDLYQNVEFDKNAGLIPQEDGTWKATRRVPLVGPCRIVDQLMHSLVSVGSYEDDLSKITDTDLKNSANVRGEGVGAEVAYNSVVAVRDLNYTYSGGQKAGFVIKTNESGVLNLNLLKQAVLVTYYLGEEQERKTVTTSSNLLGLGLGNVTVGTENSLTTLEAEFSKKFDEICLANGGVNADVLKDNLEVYYAFVGETAIEPVIKSTFPKCSTNTSDTSIQEAKLIDDNLNNGPGFGLIAAGRWRVNFGETVDPGSEVGFYVTDGSLLEIGAGATYILRTFDENGNVMDVMSSTDIVGLGLASGSDLYYSMTVNKPCSGVEFELSGLKVTVGGGTVHYAYVRKPVEPDATSYFALTNATVYVPNYRLPSVDKGKVTYEVVSGPSPEATAVDIDGKGNWAVEGMYAPGNYVVKGTWVVENGETTETHVEYATITRRVRTTKTCNDPIVNGEGFSGLEAYFPADNAAALWIPGKTLEGDLGNVVNKDVTDALRFKSLLEVGLIKVQGLLGVRKEDGTAIYNTGNSKARVGFVVNKENGAVGADVLNFYTIRVIGEGGETIVEGVSGGVNVSLIKDLTTPRVRLSVTVPANTPIYAIELHNTGLLEAQVGTYVDVYYAFLDREADSKCPDPGQECVELLNAGNYRATATVDGFAGVGAGVTISNLGNMLDGRLDSYATVAVPAGVAQKISINTKFDPIKAGTPVGFILHNQVSVAGVIGVQQLRVHYADGSYEDKTAGGAVNVTLGVDEYNYLQVIPTESRGDIVGLDLILGSGVDVQGFNICGIFSRSDANADGVPDCFEDKDLEETWKPELKLSAKDICASDDLEILVEKAVDGNYTLEVTDNKGTNYFDVTMNDAGYLVPVKSEDKDKETFLDFFSKSENAGEYALRLLVTEGQSQIESFPVTLRLHPYQTTWTGKAVEPADRKDWKNWDNWTNGEPWECTNVIIPAEIDDYPVLDAKGDYRCQSIHFEAGAVLAGQQFLKYTGSVFADVALKAGDYHLMSSPLKATITGDMFVNPSWTLKIDDFEKYFKPLTAENYAEKRVNPTVYQRFWDETIPAIVTMSRGLTDREFTDWSRTFNALTDTYAPYQGFAVRVGKAGDEGEYTLYFPKSHSKYTYFDAEGQPLMATGTINRSTQTGRLWTDNFNGKAVQYVDLLRETPGKEFLFGNPFLSYIDVAKFKLNNPGVSVWKYSDGAYSEMSKGTVAPFSAVFLVVDEDITDLEVTLDANDLTNTPSAE